jgi:peptidoglycan/xylan/chitin deacetylase (PgdA/CDA1 family)
MLATASWLGCFRLFAFLNRRRVAILFYHGVSAREAFTGIENYQGKHVRVPRFREHLELLTKRHHVLPLSNVLHALRRGLPLPPYTVVLTFDDGYENNATVALPCLRKAGLNASFFLITSLISTETCLWVDQIEQTLNDDQRDHVLVRFGPEKGRLPFATEEERREADRLIRSFCKRLSDEDRKNWLSHFWADNGIKPPKASKDYRFMSWSQVRELHSAGMTIGSHTLTHAIVTKLTETEMEREVSGAREACEQALSVVCDTFAYPNGRQGDFDERTTALLSRLGFSCGLTTVQGLNPPDANPFTLKRIGVGDQMSVHELEAHLSGFATLFPLRRQSLVG